MKRTRFLSRLGLIAGVFQELEIEKLIDEKLPKEKNHRVPHSICILSMVFNVIGFVGQLFYLFPYIFMNVSIESLFGKGVSRQDLNQYAIGETLYRISEFGPKKLFMDIVFHVMNLLTIFVIYYKLILQVSVYWRL